MANKTCKFCGEEIKEEAIKCKHCGSNLIEPETTLAPVKNKLSIGWFFGACIIPLLGIIIAIYGYIKKKENATLLLLTSIASWFFWIIVTANM